MKNPEILKINLDYNRQLNSNLRTPVNPSKETSMV